MKIKVLAFARYRELIGFAETELHLQEATCLRELLMQPPFFSLPNDALLAINNVFADGHEILQPDDEVAIMPPVSGG